MGLIIGWIAASLILLIPAVIVVLLYIVAPLMIRKEQVKPFVPHYTPMVFDGTATATMPFESPELNEFLKNLTHQANPLNTNGFQLLGHVKQSLPASRQESFSSIWVNQNTKESVQLIGVSATVVEGKRILSSLVCFRTEFTDGTAIVTSNTKNVSCFPQNPAENSLRFPAIDDTTVLYRIHRTRSAREQGNRIATLDRVQNPVARLVYEHETIFSRLVKVGYYKINSANSTYDPTLLGAFLMAYRLLFPFKQIQMSRLKRLANAELQRQKAT